MKVHNVSDTSFTGAINIYRTVSPEVANAIKSSPAMKRFGMFYRADVSQIRTFSLSKKGVSYSSLMLDNIRPKNIFVEIFDFLTGRSNRRYRGIYYSSGKQTDAGLIEQLNSVKKNHFLNILTENYD